MPGLAFACAAKSGGGGKRRCSWNRASIAVSGVVMGRSTRRKADALVSAAAPSGLSGKSRGRLVEAARNVNRSIRLHWTRPAVAAAVALALVPAGGSAKAHRDTAPSTGLRTVAYSKVPPDFTYDVGFGVTWLSAQFGKPIVVNFWATWCHPCLDEL